MTGFVSKETARQVSEDIYGGNNGKVPKGFEIDTSFGKNGTFASANGTFMYALKPDASNTSVPSNTRILGMRGTEPKATDAYADAMDVGRAQFAAAQPEVNRWLAQNIKSGNNIEVTGHSLGGALVQWTVNDENLKKIKDVPQADIQKHLHFTTFNAPGIAGVPGSPSSAHTSGIAGDHHVIAFETKPGAVIPSGDPVHLLGGAHVGGRIVAHSPNYKGQSFIEEHAAHSISNKNGNWDAPIVANYKPASLATREYQDYVQTAMKVIGQDSQPRNETEAGVKLGLALYLAGGKLGADVIKSGVTTVVDAEINAARTSAHLIRTGAEATIDISTKLAYGSAELVRKGVEQNVKMAQTGAHLIVAGASTLVNAEINAGKTVLNAAKDGVDASLDMGRKLSKEGASLMTNSLTSLGLLSAPDTPSSRVVERAKPATANQPGKP
ncbi:hypothetical protein ACO0LG_02565 [Undibacterium sp. Ji42W]|uniref:hypothetical protein n=1 Tax=Undibacterium sp. Ji42W TaxID=3413039 RepID=UPI003BEFD415